MSTARKRPKVAAAQHGLHDRRPAEVRGSEARSDAAAAHRQELLAAMLLIRRFEKRCVDLHAAARIRGVVHSCVGEEAVAVGVTQALEPSDAVVSTYRTYAHALARGVPAEAVMAELYGKVSGCGRGRGGTAHLVDAGRRFYGGSAGGGLPLAAGLALAEKMRGTSGAVCCLFGDGTAAGEEFRETADLAVLWQLPLLLACENNLHALGEPPASEPAGADLAVRVACHGMPARAVDGMDVLAVEKAARRAVDGIRAGQGPHFLELRTYRCRTPSPYDIDRRRDRSEIEQWRARDPIVALGALMRAQGELGDEEYEELERAAAETVARAEAHAEDAPFEPASDLRRFVHSESQVKRHGDASERTDGGGHRGNDVPGGRTGGDA